MRLQIRNAESGELDAIMEIYSHAKRFMEDHGNTKQWSGDDAVTREGIRTLLEKGHLFVGDEDGRIQFVFAYIQGEDPAYKDIDDGSWLNNEFYGTIHRLASAGTTKDVVGKTAAWALEKCPNLRIDTHHDNIVMQNALAKAGFTRCGIIYLPNGDPRIAHQKIK